MRLRLHAPYFSTYVSSHLPIYVPIHQAPTIDRAAVQKESKARLPAAVRENELASTRDSLSWGGIKIEFGRAVEIDLKEITASGGSRNILQLFLSQKKLTV